MLIIICLFVLFLFFISFLYLSKSSHMLFDGINTVCAGYTLVRTHKSERVSTMSALNELVSESYCLAVSLQASLIVAMNMIIFILK